MANQGGANQAPSDQPQRDRLHLQPYPPMRVIDSHTEGEPTRLIIEGGPQLGTGPLSERRDKFARAYDRYRRFCINEPRGYDALVGALLCEPADPGCVAGLIFFNNVGFLGMCGHGTIGAAVTLAHMGRIGPGTHRIETPVGVVSVELWGRNDVTIENVSSYLYRKAVTVEVPGIGLVTGDVAWGGQGPFKNVSKTPLVLGQWGKGKKYKYELTLVNNEAAKNIPVGGALRLI